MHVVGYGFACLFIVLFTSISVDESSYSLPVRFRLLSVMVFFRVFVKPNVQTTQVCCFDTNMFKMKIKSI